MNALVNGIFKRERVVDDTSRKYVGKFKAHKGGGLERHVPTLHQ